MTTHIETIIRKQRNNPTMDDITPGAIGAVKSVSVKTEIFIGEVEPEKPTADKTLWFDTTNNSIKFYTTNGWELFSIRVAAR